MSTALAATLGAVALLSARHATSARVLNRDRARGVLPDLLALLDAWELEGAHTVTIAPDGGLRTDAAKQAGYAASGNSNATTLEQTPHGRGAALDVWPTDFADYVSGPWTDVPEAIKAKFEAFGVFAEQRGLVWGGRWRGAGFANGDQPHVELQNWRAYPYPRKTT